MNNQDFFQKDEVKKLRCSYLDKLEKEITELENYADSSLEKEGKIPIDQDHYGTVHKIKGVGGTFKFPLITDVAIEILKIFTVDAKTQTLDLTEEQGHHLQDLIASMKEHIVHYKEEMGMP